MKRSLFYVAMFQQTNWIINNTGKDNIPILNAFNVRGDAVYEALEPARTNGLNIAADPVVNARGIDVLEISLDTSLFEKLLATGDIMTHMQPDALGTPLLAISQGGCQTINANSLVQTHRFWIPGREPTKQELATTRIPARHLH
jgi:hypothetical protein